MRFAQRAPLARRIHADGAPRRLLVVDAVHQRGPDLVPPPGPVPPTS
jgi:hypothetical protein